MLTARACEKSLQAKVKIMSHADVGDLDAWIQLLMGCKQLPEADVKKLCEKVPNEIQINERYRPARF